MPRAVIAEAFGPPETLALRDYDPGPPKPTHIRITLRAAGISFVDVLTAGGGYQVKPPLPFIPGSEGAGVIEEIGDEVKGFSLGQRVSVSGWGGIFAEAINLPARAVRAIPDSMSFAEAAVFPVSYATAWHALVQRGRLQANETLLVLGAGGATGYAAIQVAKRLGATVIASASSDAKRALALTGGADAIVDSRSPNWRDDVKAANGGKSVEVVFDPVGGDATEPAFRSLAWNGRHLIVGFPGGIASIRTNLALIKGASLIGVDIRQFGIFEPDLAEANRDAIFALAGQSILKPAIAASYPLDQFVEAMQAAASGSLAGRVVLTMD